VRGGWWKPSQPHRTADMQHTNSRELAVRQAMGSRNTTAASRSPDFQDSNGVLVSFARSFELGTMSWDQAAEHWRWNNLQRTGAVMLLRPFDILPEIAIHFQLERLRDASALPRIALIIRLGLTL